MAGEFDQDALNQALLMAAAGIFANNNGQQNFGSILGKGMYGALQGYSDTVQNKRKAKKDELDTEKATLDIAEMRRKIADRELMARADVAGLQPQPFDPGTRQEMAFVPEKNAEPKAPPSAHEIQRQNLQARIEFLAKNGGGHMIPDLLDKAAKFDPEYSPEVRYDQKGNAFLVSKQGDVKPLGGIKQRDEIVADNLGGQTSYRTKYNINPIGSAQHTIDPGTLFTQGQENARQGRTLAQNAFDVKESQDGNLYYVPRVPGSGQAQPVAGPGGAPLTGPKGLSETQGNATAFGMRAAAANDIINKLEASGADLGAPTQLLASNRFTNPAASATAQQAQQAKLNFMSANLRKESGAAISASEYDAEDRKYFPQIGDTPAVREQKSQMRTLAIDALKVQAGNQGAKMIVPQSSGSGSVSVNFQGKTYQFPNAAAADGFRKSVGAQ